jgi:hypothetical protein
MAKEKKGSSKKKRDLLEELVMLFLRFNLIISLKGLAAWVNFVID